MAATNQRMIDQHIASKDFYDRLIAVNTDNGWWPALKFSGMSEFITTIISDFANVPSINVNKIKARAVLQHNQLLKSVSAGKEMPGLAYLLGRSEVPFVLLPGSNPELIGDFYVHYEQMMSDRSEELKSAVEVALQRMDDVLPEGDVECALADVAATDVVKKEKPSGGKTICYVEEADPNGDNKSPLKKSPVKKSQMKKPPVKKIDLAGQEKKGKKDTKRGVNAAKKDSHNETPIEEEKCSETESQTGVPVKEIVRDTSKEPPSPLNSPSSSRAARCKAIDNKTASWHDFFQAMKDRGWAYTTGSGLASFYWIHPTHAHLTKSELLKQGTLGKDYFDSEEDVKRYAKKVYGWQGDAESPLSNESASSSKGMGLGDRVKRSNRVLKVAKRAAEAKPVIASKGKKKPMAVKKIAKDMPDSPIDEPEVDSSSTGEDDSEGYGFSQGGSIDESQDEKEVTKQKKMSNPRKRMSAMLKQSLAPVESPAGTASTVATSAFSSSADTSADPTYQIMKSRDAWTFLMKHFGFTYNRDKYCLPGKDNRPVNNPSAQEGTNFFSTIEDLRKNLCAYGLPQSTVPLSAEEEVDICRWVRYAHVQNIADGACINEDYIGGPIQQKEAWALLQRLGFKYSAGYVIPKSSTHDYERFDRAEDFYTHLARFGIPRCDVMPDPPLDSHTRLKLDLFVYNPGRHVDTFKRINPGSIEITPRRSRQSSQNAPATTLRSTTFGSSSSYTKSKDTTKPKRKQLSKFERDFSNLEQQRDFPIDLISSQKALELLKKHYGITHAATTHGSIYCFTDVQSNKELMFSTVQELRENLCEYGLPLVIEDASIDEEEKSDLESWVRCAHMKGLHGDPPSIPDWCDVLTHKEVKAVLLKLGYQMSKDNGQYALPSADFHDPLIGEDCWFNLLDFLNHIARFGVAEPKNESAKSSLSDDDIMKLELFVATHATVDFSIRVKFKSPVKKAIPEKPAYSTMQTERTAPVDAGSHEQDNALFTQPAMIETYESPTRQPTPKKPKLGILGYLKKVLTPTLNRSNGMHSAPQDAETGSSPTLSASCLEKGDEEIEACFADSTQKQSPTPMSLVKEGTALGPNIFSMEASPLKRKADDMSDKAPESLNISHNSQPRPVVHFSAPRNPSVCWAEMYNQMKGEGLRHIDGDELNAYWWIHPSCVEMKKTQLVHQCIEGEDYFKTEESLMLYAKNKLGWAGEIQSEAPEGKRRSQQREPFNVKPSPKRAAPKGTDPPAKKSRTSPHAKANESMDCDSSKDNVSSNDDNDIDSVCLPDGESIVKDKLEAAQMVLHQSFSGNYCAVSSKTSQIMKFMATAVVNSKDGEPSPAFLYVCGRPGTGKTTVVSQCADDIVSWAEAEGYETPRVGLVNMASLFASSIAKDGIQKGMLEQVAKRMGLGNDANMANLEKQAKDNVLILIIDEVDMLLKRQDSDGERFFRDLIRIANEEHLGLRLIGISNSVNDDSSTRIKEIGAPEEVVFPSYDESELLEIVTKRVGNSTVDSKALELVSRKIAATSGDARKVMEIVSNAVQRCIDSLSEEALSKEVGVDDQPPVKINHMMWAIREGNIIKHAYMIQKLPQLAKIVLCIAVAYGHVIGPKAEIRISYLKKLCTTATNHALFDSSDIGSITSFCELLCDSGLLRVANNGQFDPNDTESKLIIDVQLDDVECALDESLLNGKHGAFYSRLMEFVERKHRGNSTISHGGDGMSSRIDQGSNTTL